MISKKPLAVTFAIIFTFLTGSVTAQDLWFGDQQQLLIHSPAGIETIADLPSDLRCVARSASGGGWVALTDANLILHVDGAGNVTETVDTEVGVQAMVIDAAGRVWATRPGLDDVIVIQPGSGVVADHPVGAVPYGITIDKQGRICVTCSFGNVVQILSASGDLIQEIPVGFFPTGITAAHDGGLWIAEKDGLRKLDSLGQSIWNESVGVFPVGVTTDLAGRAWFSCQNSHQVVVVSEVGVENIIDVPDRPLGISGNGDGSVTVLCRNGGSLLRLDSGGQILEQVDTAYPLGTGDLTGLQRILIIEPDADFDNDTVSNSIEAQLGFNPFSPASCPMTFVRGDVNMDGIVTFNDAIAALLVLFGGASSNCLESLDVDDDGTLTLADPIRILDHVLAAGPSPEAPYPDLGPDMDPGEGFPCFP